MLPAPWSDIKQQGDLLFQILWKSVLILQYSETYLTSYLLKRLPKIACFKSDLLLKDSIFSLPVSFPLINFLLFLQDEAELNPSQIPALSRGHRHTQYDVGLPNCPQLRWGQEYRLSGAGSLKTFRNQIIFKKVNNISLNSEWNREKKEFSLNLTRRLYVWRAPELCFEAGNVTLKGFGILYWKLQFVNYFSVWMTSATSKSSVKCCKTENLLLLAVL